MGAERGEGNIMEGRAVEKQVHVEQRSWAVHVVLEQSGTFINWTIERQTGGVEWTWYRVDDEVVLQCVASIQKENRKFCLSAEGLGNRLCFLEPTSEAKYVPPDLCICNFVLEQSLSVRALQEMLANTGYNSEGVSIIR
ncbi:hypothetical protein JZ751_004871 [Albula glossodonta]|uniref:Inositol 1,4,5-trisphosphate/ryanodine receptor domain-containing protein n=1 Tax=Albula glossodonta TaxID=121402 RepID=A0A8T2P478_9TELE|nr:hypothetical protein JZ751_004871 [Albula glossodonta]